MTRERVVAVDIDLRQFAAWDSVGGSHVAESTFDKFQQWMRSGPTPDVLLLECASPHTYQVRQQKKRQAWVIYNSMAVSTLNYVYGSKMTVLVAPSSVWTKGLPEQVRHKLAGVIEPNFSRAKGRHDLKECQAMIWTYRNEPELWKPLAQYLEEL